MRISTNMIFDKGVARMNEQQTALLKTQQQLSANRRLLTPSDDPVAAARALDLSQGQSVNAQYGVNRRSATISLQYEESVLGNITGLIQDVQAQIIAAGNASYDDTQRGYIATELRGRFEELMGLVNSRDGEGNYVFSGYRSSIQPFTATAGGAQYQGDQGKRLLQVGPARQIQVSDSGDTVFQNIPANGTFNASNGAGNVASLGLSEVTVANASALVTPPAGGYQITFAVSGGVTTYSVNTTPATANVAFTSGQEIVIDGLRLAVTGTPANGDTVTVRPAAQQSLFKTMNDLITLLETPSGSATGKANLNYGLEYANTNLANALDNVLTVRAGVGARLKEIESLDSAGIDRDIQYSEAISNLVDLDYNKAISDLAKQKITLEAAQKSFIQTTGLSLFDLL